MTTNDPNDDELDAHVRRLLRGLPVPVEFAVSPPRRRFLHVGLAWVAGVTGLSVGGGWVVWREFSTPRIVRAAFAHARQEADVRGVHVRDFAAAQTAFGLNDAAVLPGTLQLCKDCTVGGQRAWHMNVYLDDGGYVHLFAFRRIPPEIETDGQTLDGYWQFFTSRSGFTVLALAQHRRALVAMIQRLSA
ncbi:MAG: hypothetical protein HY080_06365 [Gammaproteobacteria bacterium]|nr:hypothetical protein [Gammaproteobacteria bacterium]